MKKFFILFALVLLSCVGAWADHVTYKITSARGTFYSDNNKLCSNFRASNTKMPSPNMTDDNSRWLIINAQGNAYNGAGQYYFYNVGTDQFMNTNDGTFISMNSNAAVKYYIWVNGQNVSAYPVSFGTASTKAAGSILNVSDWGANANETGARFAGSSTTYDDGNRLAIVEAEAVTDAVYNEVLYKIAKFESTLNSVMPPTLPFVQAANTNDLNAMYILTDNPGNSICYDGTNINRVESGNASNSDAFMFIYAGGGSHYIYNKTRGVYLSWSALSSSSNASTTANSVVGVKSAPDDNCKWYIIYDQASTTSGQYDIIPAGNTSVANATHALNFRGGLSYKLNLYNRDDNQNKWRFTKIQPANVVLSKPASTISGGLNGKCVGTYASSYTAKLPAGVTAYTAEMNAEKTTVTFTKVEGSVIPANTGVLLFAENEESVNTIAAPTSEAAASISGSNAFQPMVNGSIAAGNFVLGFTAGEGVMFYPLASAKTVTNKAYISASAGSNLNAFRFDFEEGATGIETIESNTVETVFDLQGRRVQNVKSGLYIVGGKKVIR